MGSRLPVCNNIYPAGIYIPRGYPTGGLKTDNSNEQKADRRQYTASSEVLYLG